MRISEQQLDEYIVLYKKEFGEELERTKALTQVHKLVNLVMYLSFPEEAVHQFEEKLEKGYTENATHEKNTCNEF
jgi:hypothetical protein